MVTITKSDVQQSWKTTFEKAQKEMVSVTDNGKVISFIVSPKVLEDYIDGQLALGALKNGLLSESESKILLDKYR